MTRPRSDGLPSREPNKWKLTDHDMGAIAVGCRANDYVDHVITAMDERTRQVFDKARATLDRVDNKQFEWTVEAAQRDPYPVEWQTPEPRQPKQQRREISGQKDTPSARSRRTTRS